MGRTASRHGAAVPCTCTPWPTGLPRTPTTPTPGSPQCGQNTPPRSTRAPGAFTPVAWCPATCRVLSSHPPAPRSWPKDQEPSQKEDLPSPGKIEVAPSAIKCSTVLPGCVFTCTRTRGRSRLFASGKTAGNGFPSAPICFATC